MLENKSGSIAVMSSTAGKAGVPFSGTYTGSKHAIHGYFESLRTEKVISNIKLVNFLFFASPSIDWEWY